MISRTQDIDKINSVLKHPDIWPCVADEDDDIDIFMPPIDEDHHYLFYDGVLFILHPEGDKLKIHANVVPEMRFMAEGLAREALEYAFNELDAKEIIATIPVKYGNVYRFALKFMKDDGIIDDNHHLSLGEQEWAS